MRFHKRHSFIYPLKYSSPLELKELFFPIHRHLRFYFQMFRCLSLFFFIIHVISVCHFPTVTLEPTVYSRRKEPTGRMLYLSKLWLCIVKHCCLWFLFRFCPFCSLFTPTLELLCLIILSVVLLSEYECFYRFFGYSWVGDFLCLDLAELLLQLDLKNPCGGERRGLQSQQWTDVQSNALFLPPTSLTGHFKVNMKSEWTKKDHVSGFILNDSFVHVSKDNSVCYCSI